MKETEETQRKQADEALIESEEKYRNLIERANDGVIIAQDAVVTFVNTRMAEMFGYTVEEMINTHFLDYVFPDDRPRIIDIYKRRTQGEDIPSIYEMAALHKDGGRFEIEVNSGIITLLGKPATLTFVRDITKRKQMEEKLRVSERKLHLLFDCTADIVTLADANANPLWVNPAWEAIFGPLSEYNYDPLALIHPDDIEMMEAAWQALVSNEEMLLNEEYRYKASDGEFLTFESSAYPVEIEGTKLYYIIAHNITERKLAEEEIKEKAVFVEQNPAPVFNVNHEGIIITVNKAAHKISKKFRTGESVYNIFKTITKSIIENQSDDKPIQIEETIGSTTFLFTVKKDAVTKTIYFFGSNISDLRQIEGKLRDAETKLKHTFNISPGLICVADANRGYFTACNLAVTKILGMSVKKFTSVPFMEFIHPDDRQRTVDTITKQLTGSSVANFENRYRYKDGSYKWLAWQATTADKDGMVYAVATDITENKQADEALRQKVDELEQFNDATVEREHVMIELKKEVNTLLNQLGGPDKYKIVE